MINPITYLSASNTCWTNWLFYDADTTCKVGAAWVGHFTVAIPLILVIFSLVAYYAPDEYGNVDADIIGFGVLASMFTVTIIPPLLAMLWHYLFAVAVVGLTIVTVGFLLMQWWKVLGAIRQKKYESPFKKLYHMVNLNARLEKRLKQKELEVANIERHLILCRKEIPEYRAFDDSLISS